MSSPHRLHKTFFANKKLNCWFKPSPKSWSRVCSQCVVVSWERSLDAYISLEPSSLPAEVAQLVKTTSANRTQKGKRNALLRYCCLKFLVLKFGIVYPDIRDKVLISSDKTSSKILKLYFLKSRTCLLAKPLNLLVYVKMQPICV